MASLADFTAKLEIVSDAQRRPLILWNEDSHKWQDPGNDVWCHDRLDGPGWRVAHRYGFDDEGRVLSLDFPSEREAMTFFVSYLAHRLLSRSAPRARMGSSSYF